MWRRFFKLKLVPGVVIHQKFGRIDFRNENIPVDMLLQLYESDFPYLELTDLGRSRFYGVETPAEPSTSVPVQKKSRSRRG
jgi:hypothetical protein